MRRGVAVGRLADEHGSGADPNRCGWRDTSTHVVVAEHAPEPGAVGLREERHRRLLAQPAEHVVRRAVGEDGRVAQVREEVRLRRDIEMQNLGQTAEAP